MNDNSVDNLSQNPADETNASLKQTIEAKTNSSVSGVVQANSINNSTINIYPQPSKTSNSNNSNQNHNSLLPILESRKQDLIQDIAAAYKQLGTSLSEVDKTRINRLIKDLENELAQTQNKIDSSSTSANQVNNPVSTPKHNLPHRNHFFTGRVDVLNQLADLIKSNKEVTIKQAISGMGGIGKTQTALEFCHRHINDYQTILWINAENQVSFNNSYWEVAYLLELVEVGNPKSLKDNDLTFLVKGWLSNNPNWLMVLDNLEDPKLVKDYLPPNHQGHVLITTQQHDLGVIAKTITLDKMDSNTGSLFLLKRSELLSENDSLDKANPNDLSVAQEIVKEMDGLPLALDQAGAYIRQTPSSLQEYLDLYKNAKHAAKLRRNRGKHTDDHISVTATFQLAFDKVKGKTSIAAKVLEVCSFLNPNLIPEEIFTGASHFLNDGFAALVDDPLAWHEVLEALSDYSLVKRNTNNKFLSIHRLVQAVIRELLTEDNKKLCVDSLAKAFWSLSREDSNNPNTWPYYQKLLPSVTSLFEFAKFYQSNAIELAYLFHQFGLYCDTQALFTESLTFYSLALDIYKQHFGNNHPDVAFILNNIGIIYDSQNRHTTALEYYNQALDIYMRSFDNNQFNINIDIYYANTLSNIATTYQQQAKYTEALNFHQKALSIYQPYSSNNPVDLAKSFNNIATLYQAQGKYQDALEYFLQALDIKKHRLGNNHPDVAATLNNIAILYQAQAYHSLALDFFNQALTIYKHLFSNNHPDVAATLNNIAIIYDLQGKYQDALDLYNQSLSIYEYFSGNNSSYAADCFLGIGNIYHQQGNYSLALTYYNQALDIKKLHFGDNHPDVVSTLNNIGATYCEQADYSHALSCYNQALSIYKDLFGDYHPDIAGTLNNIGEIYRQQGNYPEALDHFNQSFHIYKHHFGDNHPSIALTLNSIGVTFYNQDKYNLALEHYNLSLSIKKHVFGNNHPDVAMVLNNIGLIYQAQSNYSQALDFYNQSLSITKHHFGDNHRDVAITLANLGHLHKTINKEIEAIDYYKQALAIYDQVFPPTHPCIAELLDTYSQLLLKLNRTGEAQPLLDRLSSLKQSKQE